MGLVVDEAEKTQGPYATVVLCVFNGLEFERLGDPDMARLYRSIAGANLRNALADEVGAGDRASRGAGAVASVRRLGGDAEAGEGEGR